MKIVRILMWDFLVPAVFGIVVGFVAMKIFLTVLNLLEKWSK